MSAFSPQTMGFVGEILRDGITLIVASIAVRTKDSQLPLKAVTWYVVDVVIDGVDHVPVVVVPRRLPPVKAEYQRY